MLERVNNFLETHPKVLDVITPIVLAPVSVALNFNKEFRGKIAEYIRENARDYGEDYNVAIVREVERFTFGSAKAEIRQAYAQGLSERGQNG